MTIYETYLTNKQAAFDLPDLRVNPKNKMTRLMKNLKWGVKVNGKPESPDETTFIFNLDPKTKYEVIGDDSSNIASCVDLTNRVVKNMNGIGSLATLTSYGGIPHLTPLFKHKGKYYLVHGEHQYSHPYNSLDEVGDRWYTDPSVPVPEYVDFYNLPAGETIAETNLRKVIEEIKRKAKNTYRKDYTHREGYKLRNDKYTIHGAILGCLGNNAKKFDYNITEKLPNDPWKAIINTKPMTMEQVQQFHKYHKKDVDKAGVPYYFLTRNERTGEKAVWYSDDPNPIPINNKKEIEYAQQVGKAKGLVPDQLNFKFTEKQASKLYTYVDPEADLSLGLLSLRNVPEDAAIRRYGRHVKDPKNLNKEYIVQQVDSFAPGRPDWIYGLDAPIPDYANEGLIRFRNARKLVSWDPEKVKDLVKIIRKYHTKRTREEVPPNFEPLKRIQWSRIPKDRTSFRYAPIYKVLTESGRIPPELLTKE